MNAVLPTCKKWNFDHVKKYLFFADDKQLSEYEEVNSSNCVTMIAVMPGSGGNMNSASTATSVLEAASDSTTTSLVASRSETSSSEGGSFIIDGSFYENLNFHRIRASMVRTSSEVSASEDPGSHPDLSKFGYSQREVWNWLYTDHDLNHNRPQKDSKASEMVTVLPTLF